MAAIDTILSQIINAKYGREVRQAIHDGIQQCYADAIVGIKGDQGTSITSVARTSGNGAEGTTDIYTVTFSNNTSSTFQVRHGSKGSTGLTGAKGDKGDKGDTITSIIRTAGNGAEGTVDTYTITMSSGDTSTFQVRNGSKGSTGDTGPKGDKGDQGVSITNIVRTSGTGAEGTTDVYTITLSNGVQSTFNVRNGSKGSQGIQGPIGNTGAKGDKGDPGVSITNIVRTSGTGEEGTTDIYTIYLSSGASQTFTVKHGSRGPVGATGVGIRDVRKISGTGAEGTVDTYAVMLSDGENKNFDVRHGSKGSTGSKGDPGKGVVGINKVSGTGSPGTVDTYAISYTDGTVTNFNVYNGADGAGSPTAQKLANARALTIGAVSKLFDGSEDVTWSLEELDLAPRLHTHTTSQITDFPTEMPASDVYEWAKAQTKPTYIPTEVGAASEFHQHTTSDITNFPSSMPASDVESWAKALTKPSYTPEEVGAAPVLHNHTTGSITDFPETMPPSPHAHSKNDITDFPTEMPPEAHNHPVSDLTDFPTEFPPEAHAHGNITSDGKIGTNSDNFLLTGAGGGIEARSLQEAVRVLSVKNENLFHNWNFLSPINQRDGIVLIDQTVSQPGYFYDRWYTGGDIFLSQSYVSIRVGAYIEQRFERGILEGKLLTITFMVHNGTRYYTSVTMPSLVGEEEVATIGSSYIRLGVSSSEYSYVRFERKADAQSTLALRKVKLELGPISTLDDDDVFILGEELLKCQRYFLRSNINCPVFGYIATTIIALYPTPVTMRIAPTLISNHSLRVYHKNGVTSDIPITGVSLHHPYIRFNAAIHPDIDANQPITGVVVATAPEVALLLSAEL